MIKVNVEKKILSAHGAVKLQVDLDIAQEELIALYGPSGAGKTTILRMIAGLTAPDSGMIEVDGEIWFDSRKRINRPVQERRIGFVFQDYNLFPNMTVWENLGYALKDKKNALYAEELLRIVDLTEIKNLRPHILSGGQRQRIALIRALLRRPKIFLLDEPLSALDLELRLKLQDDILAIQRKVRVPTVFVTHDLGELFKISSRVFVLEQGKVVRFGRPEDIFAGSSLSCKFKFVGNILGIERDGFMLVVTVQIGQTLTKVAATEEEASDLQVGDKVLVMAKAFHPILFKL